MRARRHMLSSGPKTAPGRSSYSWENPSKRRVGDGPESPLQGARSAVWPFPSKTLGGADAQLSNNLAQHSSDLLSPLVVNDLLHTLAAVSSRSHTEFVPACTAHVVQPLSSRCGLAETPSSAPTPLCPVTSAALQSLLLLDAAVGMLTQRVPLGVCTHACAHRTGHVFFHIWHFHLINIKIQIDLEILSEVSQRERQITG